MPLEYCEHYPHYDKCKEWLQKNLPDEFEKRLQLDENTTPAEEEKKRQKRGGKGVVKVKKKSEKERKIQISRSSRSKKKCVTVVTGLHAFGLDLKDAAKKFCHKFSCGSSVTGEDEIVIQGDVKDELLDVITELWPEIDEEAIEDYGE